MSIPQHRRLLAPVLLAAVTLFCAGEGESEHEAPAEPTGQNPPGRAGEASDAEPRRAPEIGQPPFNPLGYPDWFTARDRFSHARLQTAVDEDGTLQGVRVLSVHQGLRPANLTLQPGDLLLRINGVSLTDPVHKNRVQEIVAWAFLRADQISVRLRRDGEEFSLVEMAPVKAESSAGP